MKLVDYVLTRQQDQKHILYLHQFFFLVQIHQHKLDAIFHLNDLLEDVHHLYHLICKHNFAHDSWVQTQCIQTLVHRLDVHQINLQNQMFLMIQRMIE